MYGFGKRLDTTREFRKYTIQDQPVRLLVKHGVILSVTKDESFVIPDSLPKPEVSSMSDDDLESLIVSFIGLALPQFEYLFGRCKCTSEHGRQRIEIANNAYYLFVTNARIVSIGKRNGKF